MPECSSFSNPDALTVIVYSPGSRKGITYCPAPSLTVRFTVPVWVSVATTLAAGTAAPDGSVIAPEIVPRNSCARAMLPARPARASRTTPKPIPNRCVNVLDDRRDVSWIIFLTSPEIVKGTSTEPAGPGTGEPDT